MSLQAEQKAVIQQANFDLLQIRQIEVDYFLQVFSAFGTQSAFIAGFSTALLSTDGTRAPQFFQYLYYVFSTIAFVASMQVVLTSAFVTVYGQSLALHGPPGSMVKAIGGMVDELQTAVMFFVVALTSFTLSSIGVHWLQFSELGAILCNVVVIVGMTSWYIQLVRVFNRFRTNAYDHKDHSTLAFEKEKVSRESLAKAESEHFFEGYITTTLGTGSTLSLPGSDPWKVRYGVLEDTLIYFYKDKRTYLTKSAKPVPNRPIDLDGFKLEVKGTSGFVLHTVREDDDRKSIELRCSSLHDLQQWVEAVSKGIRLAAKASALDESSTIYSEAVTDPVIIIGERTKSKA